MPGVLARNGVSLYMRKYMFYLICIPLRLSLAYGLYKYSYIPTVRVLSIFLSVIATLNVYLKMKENDEVWWSRKFHFASSLLITFLTVFNRFDLASLTMASDVVFGVWTSRKGFKNNID